MDQRFTAPWPNVAPTSRLRADFNAVREKEAQLGNRNALPTVGFLRSDYLLNGAFQALDFPVKDGKTVPGQQIMGVENRLKDNDAFYVTDIGVFFRVVDFGGSGNYFLAGGVDALQSWGDPYVFGADGGSAVERAYQGNLECRVDETIYIDALDMLSFRRASVAQAGLAASDAAAANTYGASEWKGNDAFKECSPMIRMNGQGNNEWRVNLPEPIDFNAGTTENIAAVLYLRGLYVQNAGDARAAARTR